MRKLSTLLLASLAFISTANAQITETATDAVKNMGMGWNLGNTLESHSNKTTDVTSDSYWYNQGLEAETSWGQPKATKELITMMKNAGFSAIRVPVTWYNHMDSNGNVNAEWMARVKEVVDYVIDNGMYCILNVHHDTGADANDGSFVSWLKADATNYTNNKARYEKLWKQIATEFKDYDKHLLFESYNEMLDAKSTWNAPVNTTTGYAAINNYAQSFVTTVRATGGNNATRNLVVNTYAAANAEAVSHLTVPTDNVSSHIAVEVHAYPNFYTWTNPTLRTISQVKSDVDYIINNLKTNVINKGYAAIIGEWGSYGVDNGAGKTDYDLLKDMFFEFCEYFITKAKASNIAMFYWMGMSDGDYRSQLVFNQADLAKLFCETYNGTTSGYEFPEPTAITSITAFEGEKALAWGDNGRISISGSKFEMIGSSVKLVVTYTQTVASGSDIQLYYGDWSSKPSFTVDGKTYSGDFDPSSVYKTGANTQHTTEFTFDEDTYKNLASKGLIIFGTGETVTKVELVNAATGIESVVADETPADNAIYNLSGQRISKPSHGIYIMNGKKYMAK